MFSEYDSGSSTFSSSKFFQQYTDDNNIKFFKCLLCEYTTSHSANLKRHAMIHTGEKPYKCHYCSKSFVQKVQLNSHARVHTGERPFTCEVCMKSFSDKGNCKRHMKTHLINMI